MRPRIVILAVLATALIGWTMPATAGAFGVSARGQEFVFWRYTADDFSERQVFVTRADGSVRQLTTGPSSSDAPVWSPSGLAILFTRTDTAGQADLWVMDPTGRLQVRLTRLGDVGHSWWSPDGRQVVFERETATANDLWVMDVGGTHLRNITNTPDTYDVWPAWSPNGRVIAFARVAADFSYADLVTVAPDGSLTTSLTQSGSGYWTMPAWTPRGDGLALANFGSLPGIYTMDAHGTNLQRLRSTGNAPSWSPDACSLAFADNGDIVITRGDGTSVTTIDSPQTDEFAPRWRPSLLPSRPRCS